MGGCGNKTSVKKILKLKSSKFLLLTPFWMFKAKKLIFSHSLPLHLNLLQVTKALKKIFGNAAVNADNFNSMTKYVNVKTEPINHTTHLSNSQTHSSGFFFQKAVYQNINSFIPKHKQLYYKGINSFITTSEKYYNERKIVGLVYNYM